jgi:hypothetical protein
MQIDAQVGFSKAKFVAGLKQRLLFVSHAWLLGCAAVLWSAPRNEVLFRAIFREPPEDASQHPPFLQ